jgi:hypothetical protein
VHNTEDKQWWVIEWAKREVLFVEKVCPELGLLAGINPEKSSNRYAPDLVVSGLIADLKCQQTPFFKARDLYGLDPQFAVTFNRKDYLRYKEQYPTIIVYFWVDWQGREKVIRGTRYAVQPLAGVWRAAFSALAALIESEQAPLHTYQRRQGDTQGNARDSYIIDLRRLECLRQMT